MTPEQLVRQYGHRLYQVVDQDCEKIKALAHEGIEAILAIYGIEFDWRHSSQPFREFIGDLEYSEEARAELLRRWDIVQSAEDESRAVYQCVSKASGN